jgi:hypothetical protein
MVLYFVFGSAGVCVVVSQVLQGLGPKSFLNGHTPPLQQPDKNIPIAASNNEIKIVLLRFICIVPFVQ